MLLIGSRGILRDIESAILTSSNSAAAGSGVFDDADELLRRVVGGEQPTWPGSESPSFEQAFLERSRHHGVEALIHRLSRLSKNWNTWPQSVREALEEATRAAVAFDMFRRHKVEAFLAGLAQRGIDFLVVKGEALSHTHYAEASLRSRGDTDVFIRQTDIESVRGVLAEFDFEVIPPIYKTHQFGAVLARGSHSAVRLDVHWRILNAPRFARIIDFEDAFRNSTSVPGMNGCRTLRTVDALLLACMHREGSENHDRNRLIWLYDIHLLVATMTKEELEGFALKALEKGVLSCCRNGLTQAVDSIGTKLPDYYLPQMDSLCESENKASPYRYSQLGLLVDDLVQLPGFKAKWDLTCELLFPTAGQLLTRYQASSRLWLPWLYLRYLASGIGRRLILR